MSTTRLPGPERRVQLMTVARSVLAERGFHETSMNDIAAAAGVTKPVLYQHFASKRELHTAVLTDIGRRLQDTVIASAASADTPKGQVEAGFEAYIQFVEDDPDGFSLLFSGSSRQDPEWGIVTSNVELSIADAIASLIAVEGMSKHHRLTLAHGIVGLAESMMRFWQREVGTLDRDELLRDLVALAWVGLRGLEPGQTNT